MKKIIFLFAFLCIQSIGYSQLNFGANGILHFPVADFKLESNLVIGGAASIGYTFDKRLDLSLVYTLYNYSSGSAFGLNSKTVEAKFFFLNGDTRPYIGCGVGSFRKSITSSLLPKYVEDVWGFEPKAGILLDSKSLKDLFVDVSVSYMYAKTKFNAPKAFNLAVGLKYMIKGRKSN